MKLPSQFGDIGCGWESNTTDEPLSVRPWDFEGTGYSIRLKYYPLDPSFSELHENWERRLREQQIREDERDLPRDAQDRLVQMVMDRFTPRVPAYWYVYMFDAVPITQERLQLIFDCRWYDRIEGIEEKHWEQHLADLLSPPRGI